MFRILLTLITILALSACRTPYKTTFQASPGMVNASVAHQFRSECYITQQGVQVSQFATECPAQAIVESIIQRALGQVGVADQQLLNGLHLVFVPQVIICGPPEDDLITLGCTLADGSKAFVFLAGALESVAVIIAHEMGHVIRVRTPEVYEDGDGSHLDRDFWEAVQDVDLEKFK